MASRTGIDALIYLLDEAFRGRGIEDSDESQALLPNLATVPHEAWRALPDGAARSIEAIVIHVGACKIMYDDYAFGTGTLQWGTPEVEPWADGQAPREAVVPWLDGAHARLVEHVGALADDTELDKPRLANWGRKTADALADRRDDHPRRVPRRRDQSPPVPPRWRRPLAPRPDGPVVEHARFGPARLGAAELGCRGPGS